MIRHAGTTRKAGRKMFFLKLDEFKRQKHILRKRLDTHEAGRMKCNLLTGVEKKLFMYEYMCVYVCVRVALWVPNYLGHKIKKA